MKHHDDAGVSAKAEWHLYEKSGHQNDAVNSQEMAPTVRQIWAAAQVTIYALLDYSDSGGFRGVLACGLPAG